VILTLSFRECKAIQLFFWGGGGIKDDFPKEAFSFSQEDITGGARNIFRECEVCLEAGVQQVGRDCYLNKIS